MTTTLVYDGDCAICTSSARLVERWGLDVDEVIPWQHADLDALGLTAAQCQEAVQLVEDGRVTSAHEAIGRLLQRSGGPWRLLGGLAIARPTSWLAAPAYRWVARNRHRLPGGTPACAMPPPSADRGNRLGDD